MRTFFIVIFVLVCGVLDRGIWARLIVDNDPNQFLITAPKPKEPIILIPGDGGSQLMAKLNKPFVVHYVCNKVTKDYYDLWLNLELMVPLILDCWVDNMSLRYNNRTRKTSNAPGVDIQVPGFGDTNTVEWLDPSQISPSKYFADLATVLVKDGGYVRNKTLRGAPYDFRKAPNEMEDFFTNLKNLVEETSAANQGRSVALLTHSMGGPVALYFLQRADPAWKKKYISRLVSLSSPWGGAVKALKVFLAGDNLGIFVVSQKTLRQEQYSCPSLSFLLPRPELWKDTPLVMTPSRNYSASEYPDIFSAMSYPQGRMMWEDTKDLIDPWKGPGVPTYCLYGTGVPTMEQVRYAKNSSFPLSPSLVMGEGDGTVNLRSLRICQGWKETVVVKEFPSADHMQTLRDTRVSGYLTSLFSESGQS